ncbi:cytochrome oxidase complex assembly protein 1-domain-containing protein [Chaetomium strumarium]|uniref:Cytochrome oxidase complex assembly protein 1-domain-containing protein n=1 Tax=Chaetomium strumarium TaxID=1170767 RepID=A0AAJ0GQY7_9PEZI|nr:cytochrome oxidase complex assembly protein 1-domain-containing protein [Chaetomium strumarium]
MLSRLAPQRAGAQAAALLRRRIVPAAVSAAEAPVTRQLVRQQRRTFVSAPKKGDGPLLERRPDRELPDLDKITFRWSRTLPLFAAVIAVASLAIFNYQKLSSPVVGATLYALRTSDKARAHLGDEIYFAQQIPWISGEMNQLHGRINISFRVKGTRAGGVMRFASYRPTPRGLFETTEWSLETDDGTVIDLLEDGDPFKGIVAEIEDDEEEIVQGAAATRGFRQQMKK